MTTFSAGTTGFTPSTATAGAITLAGTLGIANGGTNATSFTAKSGNVAGLVFFDGTKLANDAIAAVNSAPKPNPSLTDDQWAGIKKDFLAQAHDTLGVMAGIQKKYDVAVKEFQTSIQTASTPDMATPIRLAFRPAAI